MTQRIGIFCVILILFLLVADVYDYNSKDKPIFTDYPCPFFSDKITSDITLFVPVEGDIHSADQCHKAQAAVKKNYEEWQKQQVAEAIKFTENMKATGCGDIVFGQCEHDGKKYDFSREDYMWIESADSKLCSKYYELTVADVPVKCLDYFGLRK